MVLRSRFDGTKIPVTAGGILLFKLDSIQPFNLYATMVTNNADELNDLDNPIFRST